MSVKLLVKSAVNRGSEAAYGRFETRGRQTPRPTRTSLWLQLATIGAASTIFDEQVIEPAAAARPGVARLRAYVERFLGHVEDGVFPGGCFFVSAVSELDSHPGPVRDGAMAFSARWLGLLAEEVAAAQAAGELDPGADPSQVAFELNAYMVLGNMQFVATGDPSALDRVRRAVEDRLDALAA